MVQVYALTQLWDPVGHWTVLDEGRLVQFNLPDLCYGNPCTGIYDQGPGLAGAVSSIDMDDSQLGIKGFPQVEVGFSARLAFVGYYNPSSIHRDVPPINVRTVFGGQAAYDDLVPFLTFNGDTQRLDLDSPPMALISHTNTVSIPENRTLTVQLLFDLTPVINRFSSDYYTPFLITDHVSLYAEGRPPKSGSRPMLIGLAIGWAVVFLLAVAGFWLWRKRRGERRRGGGYDTGKSVVGTSLPSEPLTHLPPAHPAAVPRPFASLAVSTSTPPSRTGSVPGSAPGSAPATAAGGISSLDALGEYAASHRSHISPELEQKLRDAGYYPLDDPDLTPAATWQRRYGVSERELGMLRELYAMNRGWRQTALSG